MRKFLRIVALLSALAVVAFWFASGAHTGWSQTSVPTKHIDPVTEIEFTEYEQRFRPGIEFLAVGIAGSAVLFAVTFLFPRRKSHHPQP